MSGMTVEGMEDTQSQAGDEVKDYAYYLANPDDAPENLDFEALALAAGELDNDDSGTNDAPKEPAKAEEAKEEPKRDADDAVGDPSPPTSGDEAEPIGEGDPDPDGVLTRDGKNVIPYHVLTGTRQDLNTANQSLSAMKEQNEDLQAKIAALEAGNRGGQDGDKPAETVQAAPEFDYEGAVEEHGQFAADQMKTTHDQKVVFEQKLAALEGTVGALQNESVSRKAAEEVHSGDKVQAAIDANPVLAGWQAEKDPMFEAAVAVDNRLRAEDPAYRNKVAPGFEHLSKADQFSKVLELLGHTPQPTQKTPPKPTNEQLEAKAGKAIAEAPAKVPSSLSEVGGGSLPNTTEAQNIEEMTVFELGSNMENMTPDQLDAYLDNASS